MRTNAWIDDRIFLQNLSLTFSIFFHFSIQFIDERSKTFLHFFSSHFPLNGSIERRVGSSNHFTSHIFWKTFSSKIMSLWIINILCFYFKLYWILYNLSLSRFSIGLKNWWNWHIVYRNWMVQLQVFCKKPTLSFVCKWTKREKSPWKSKYEIPLN